MSHLKVRLGVRESRFLDGHIYLTFSYRLCAQGPDSFNAVPEGAQQVVSSALSLFQRPESSFAFSESKMAPLY